MKIFFFEALKDQISDSSKQFFFMDNTASRDMGLVLRTANKCRMLKDMKHISLHDHKFYIF